MRNIIAALVLSTLSSVALAKGVIGYTMVQKEFTVPANTSMMAQFSVNCAAGKVVLSCGFLLQGDASVVQNQPVVNGVYGCLVGVNNHQNFTIPIFVTAVCAKNASP
jgi:hypothetical protein